MQRFFAIVLLGMLLTPLAVTTDQSTAHACSMAWPPSTPPPDTVPGDGTPFVDVRFPADPATAIEILTADSEPMIVGAMRLTTIEMDVWTGVQVVDGLWGTAVGLPVAPTEVDDSVFQFDPHPNRNPIQTVYVTSCGALGSTEPGLSTWILLGRDTQRYVTTASITDGNVWADGLTRLFGEPEFVDLGEYTERLASAKSTAPLTTPAPRVALPAVTTVTPTPTSTVPTAILGLSFGLASFAALTARVKKRWRPSARWPAT